MDATLDPADVAQTRIDDLDLLGVLEGTDKSSSLSWSWDYLRHYQSYFGLLRHAPITLLEIGVLGGSSLRMWRAWLSKAKIVGVDIDPACRRYASEGVEIEIGSQDDPGFLAELTRKYSPTIIIDDGSHQAHHIIYTFERLFPALAPGGYYVVEDLAFHFGELAAHWKGAGEVSVGEYFSRLARWCMARQSREADLWGTERFLAEQIETIIVIPGALLIRRKAASPTFVADAETLARGYLPRDASGGAGFARLVSYLLRSGNLEGAERAAERAGRLGALTYDDAYAMAELRDRQGRAREAMEIVYRAAIAKRDDRGLWENVAARAEGEGRLDWAEEAYRKLAAMSGSAADEARLAGFLERTRSAGARSSPGS